MTTPITPSGSHPVHCCVCLNTDGGRTVAEWITDSGYLLCDRHRDTDIPAFLKTVVKRQRHA